MRTQFNDFTQPCSQKRWEGGCEKKKPANAQRIVSSKTFLAIALSNRLLSVGSYLQ